jgi:hypothetical protein
VALMPPLFLSILVSYFPSKQSCCETLEHRGCNAMFALTPRYFFSHLFESNERAQSIAHCTDAVAPIVTFSSPFPHLLSIHTVFFEASVKL